MCIFASSYLLWYLNIPRYHPVCYNWHGMAIKCNSMNVKVQLVGTRMKLLHWIWVVKQASKLIVHIGSHIMTWLVQSNCRIHQCMHFKFLNMVHRQITIQSTCMPNHELLNYQNYVVKHHRHLRHCCHMCLSWIHEQMLRNFFRLKWIN